MRRTKCSASRDGISRRLAERGYFDADFMSREVRVTRADFAADHKWQNYLDYADRFFWAVDAAFPTEILPEGTGLIVADRFGGEILRYGPEAKLAAARRRALTLGFARTAALRLQGRADPAAPSVPGRLTAFL